MMGWAYFFVFFLLLKGLGLNLWGEGGDYFGWLVCGFGLGLGYFGKRIKINSMKVCGHCWMS
jgi:hypothetical protein